MLQPSDRPVAAIVSLDLYGYSRLTEQDEAGTHRALMNCWRKQLTPIVDHHRGVIVKSTGDGALIRFSDAPAAVKAMIQFQETVTAGEASFPESRRLVFRIGIHLTSMIQENGDIFGHGVNLAVRLQEAAEPGTIFLSKAMVSNLNFETVKALKNAGTRRFKNIEGRTRVYCWRGEATSSLSDLRPVSMRMAALLFLAMTMPAATSKDIGTTFQSIDTVLRTDRLNRNPDSRLAANAAPYSLETALTMSPHADIRLALAASSATLLEERSTTDQEWIMPYHGLAQGPPTKPVSTMMTAADRSLENRFEIAEDAYFQAIALYNRHTPSAFAKAIEELDDALILKPDHDAARALLTAIYWGGLQNRWQLGKGLTRNTMLRLAERHLALATDTHPLAQMVASEMLTARGRHDLAIQRAERALKLAPESAVNHYARGRALLFAGRTAEAEGPVRIAIRLDPHAARYLFGLALVQFNMNRFVDANRTLARLTARNSDDDWPHLLMAATQGYLGLRAGARQSIGRFDRLSLMRRGWFASQIPYVHSWPFQDDDDRNRLHQGLVLAGMPDLPR